MKKFVLGVGGIILFLVVLAACLPGPWAWNLGTILGHITYAITSPFTNEPQSDTGRLIQILSVWAATFALPVLIAKFIISRPKKEKKNMTLPYKEIEKELREKYNLLSHYFDDVFPWFRKEVKKKHDDINAVAQQKNVPPPAVLYAILFFQVTEQLKFGDWYVHRGRLNMRGFDLYALWKYLADKLEHYQYFPAEEMEQRRKEIDEWISNNG